MLDRSEWTTADFETLSWHDCQVHGFRLEEGEHGTAEVTFDIDFIVEWLCHSNRPAEFRVAPATLTFHAVFGLRIELDYAAVTAGMTPFSLSGIEREELRYPGGQSSFRWRLPISWPSGMIGFDSQGFTQVLRRAPILVDRQGLRPAERPDEPPLMWRVMAAEPERPVAGEIVALHHVQLAMPAGQEAVARAFYCDVLGLSETSKPAHLAVRGGVWFCRGRTRLHLGVESDFRAARKAHPALLVRGLAEIAARCQAAGFPAVRDEPVEGFDRIYVSDPFGNRIELLEPIEKS